MRYSWWLQAHNPSIDWGAKIIKFDCCPSHCHPSAVEAQDCRDCNLALRQLLPYDEWESQDNDTLDITSEGLDVTQHIRTHLEHFLPDLDCYDPPHFSHLPYPSSTIPTLISFDLKPITKPTVPPVIFPNATPPELMGKAPLPLNPPSLLPLEDLPPRPEWTKPAMPEQIRPATPQWTSPSQVIMTRLPSPAMSIYLSFDLPSVPSPVPIPWSTHH